jgi:small-conductance mechanosensitive channel
MTATSQERPPYLWALATFALVLLIYLLTLAPTTAFWDASEYIAAARVLGIPHPPGNPLFVILAHVFGLLPLAESYAVRINMFAAVTSAGAAAFWFLVADRWLRGIVPSRWARYGAAMGGA